MICTYCLSVKNDLAEKMGEWFFYGSSYIWRDQSTKYVGVQIYRLLSHDAISIVNEISPMVQINTILASV